MRIAVGVLLAILIGYSAGITLQWTRHGFDHGFFGAKIDGKYVDHFGGKIRCAFVVGWHETRKCMCFLTEHDSRLENDKTLIASEPQACESKSDEVSPE